MPAHRVVETPDSPVQAADFVKAAGLRLVRPYYFDFICSVKDRWTGRSAVDVLHHEFPARPREYYEAAYADGRLRLEGAPPGAPSSQPLHQGLRIRHYTHRHEPPVLDLPIPVLGVTDDLVAVGKPPSLPVHASGPFRKNSVAGVLQAEAAALGPLRPVHRLDNSVSGVLLLARSAAAAHALNARIQAGDVEKVYVARVLGVFPAAPVRLDLALAWNPRTNHVTAVPAGPRVGGASPAPACGGGGGGGGGGDEGRAASSDARAAQPSTLDERPGACASCEPGLPAASRGCCNADGSGVGRRCACQPGGTAARGEVAGGACVGPVADMGDPAGQASAADAGDADADEAARDGRNEGARGGLPGDARGDLAAARAQRKRERAARSAAAADRRAAAHAAVTVRVAAAAAAEAAGFDPAAAAKPALSVFRRLAVAPDGRTSVVECRPRTGRTHQLRVHLQALGHPIANDVQYGGPFPGPDRHRSWLAGDAEPAAAGLGVGAAHVVPPGPGESACAAAGGAAAPGDCAAAAPGAPAAALCGACDGAAHAAAGSAARAGGGGHAAAAAAAPAGARGDEPAAAAAGPPAGGGAAPEPGPGAAQPAGRSTESAPAAVLAQAAWLGGEHGTGGCAGARDSARAGERGVRAGAAPAAAAAALAAEDAGREQSARPDAGQGAASCNPDPGADPEGPHMEGRRAARGAPAGPAAEPGGLLPVLERAACDPMCPHCPSVALEGYPVPPRPLWLHARRYACADWAFECPLPAWAEPGFAPSVE